MQSKNRISLAREDEESSIPLVVPEIHPSNRTTASEINTQNFANFLPMRGSHMKVLPYDEEDGGGGRNDDVVQDEPGESDNNENIETRRALGNAIRIGNMKEVKKLTDPRSHGRNILKSKFQFQVTVGGERECVQLILTALHLAIICGHNYIVSHMISNGFAGGDRFIVDLLADTIRVKQNILYFFSFNNIFFIAQHAHSMFSSPLSQYELREQDASYVLSLGFYLQLFGLWY